MKVDELQRWKLQEGPWFTKMAKAEDGNLIFYSDAKAEIRKMDNLIVEQGAQLDQIDSLLNGEDVCDFALSYPVIRKVSDLIFTSKAIEEELRAAPCKTCGSDPVVAEIGRKLGFRPDLAFLRIKKLEEENDRLKAELAEARKVNDEKPLSPEEMLKLADKMSGIPEWMKGEREAWVKGEK